MPANGRNHRTDVRTDINEDSLTDRWQKNSAASRFHFFRTSWWIGKECAANIDPVTQCAQDTKQGRSND